MITYFDLIKDESFRDYLLDLIRERTKDTTYRFFAYNPTLFRYRSFSKYAIEDIENQTITLSSIGEFNDIYDGTIHILCEGETYRSLAEKDMAELDELGLSSLGFNDQAKEEMLLSRIKYYEKESRLKQRTLETIGTYVGCFTGNYLSILMWAHYANFNQGICIEYDFNTISNGLDKALFPVAYINEPVHLYDLINPKDKPDYPYQLDAAFLCAAIAKSDIWRYEEESRLVIQLPFFKDRRISLNIQSFPTSLILGNDFLKNFFYDGNKDGKDYNDAKDALELFHRLLNCIEKNGINLQVVDVNIGKFELTPCETNSIVMKDFFNNEFEWEPVDIRFYYVLKDSFFNIVRDSEDH